MKGRYRARENDEQELARLPSLIDRRSFGTRHATVLRSKFSSKRREKHAHTHSKTPAEKTLTTIYRFFSFSERHEIFESS